MKKLSDIVLCVLDVSVTPAALRYSVRGPGSSLCQTMIEARRNLGVGGLEGQRSHNFYLRESVGSKSEYNLPLPPDVRSSVLSEGQLIKERNNKSMVTLYPINIQASSSMVEAETELTKILNDSEKIFFAELGYEDGVPEWYLKLCEEILDSPNLRKRWKVRSLSEVRWKVLESVDRLVQVKGQNPQFAFASVIGVPCEPQSGPEALMSVRRTRRSSLSSLTLCPTVAHEGPP